MTRKVPVKRKITEFDFEGEGASVHLVSKKQGGAANGHKTLIMKSQSTSEELNVDSEDLGKVEKARLEQIRVTMSMEEFLRKFFDMYYSDAELLTSMLGFETEYEAYLSDTSEPDYQSFLQEQLQGFEVMKSLNDGVELELSGLDCLTILELQEKIEKNLKEEMMDKITIEKSRYEALEKAEKDVEAQVELVKSLEGKLEEANNTIEKMKTDQSISKAKDRLEGLVAEEKIESLAKSLASMDEESATALIESLQEKKELIEKSNLFKEDGHGQDTEIDKKKSFEESLAKSLQEET